VLQELLNLRDNRLSGLIPPGPYPSTLYELDLSINSLEGFAGGAGFDPSAWTELVNLETLLLSHNNLTWDK
jgi:Leucine-rich repeat (LRR) protein